MSKQAWMTGAGIGAGAVVVAAAAAFILFWQPEPTVTSTHLLQAEVTWSCDFGVPVSIRSPMPDGMTATDNRLDWKPTSEQAGMRVFLQTSTGGWQTPLRHLLELQVIADTAPDLEIPKELPQAQAGHTWSATLTITDDTVEDWTCRLLQAPEGVHARVAGDQVILNWLPPDDAIGNHALAIAVSDGIRTSRRALSLTVAEAPTKTPMPVVRYYYLRARAGETVSLVPDIPAGMQGPVTWKKLGGPAHLEAEADSGRATWTAADDDSGYAILTATDATAGPSYAIIACQVSKSAPSFELPVEGFRLENGYFAIFPEHRILTVHEEDITRMFGTIRFSPNPTQAALRDNYLYRTSGRSLTPIAARDAHNLHSRRCLWLPAPPPFNQPPAATDQHLFALGEKLSVFRRIPAGSPELLFRMEVEAAQAFDVHDEIIFVAEARRQLSTYTLNGDDSARQLATVPLPQEEDVRLVRVIGDQLFVAQGQTLLLYSLDPQPKLLHTIDLGFQVTRLFVALDHTWALEALNGRSAVLDSSMRRNARYENYYRQMRRQLVVTPEALFRLHDDKRLVRVHAQDLLAAEGNP